MPWRTRLPYNSFGILAPAMTTRPNPVVARDRVFATIFAARTTPYDRANPDPSRGAVCCADRSTGTLLWTTLLDSFAGSSVTASAHTVYVSSARTIYALSAATTGRVQWQYTPYAGDGEDIYSQPGLHRRRIFFGDRDGYFHCLDARTGRTLWRRLTSRDENNSVNATALAAGARVITGNNAGAVICYDVATGRSLWRRNTGAPLFARTAPFRESSHCERRWALRI